VQELSSETIKTTITEQVSKGLSYMQAYRMLDFVIGLTETEPDIIATIEEMDYDSLLEFKESYQEYELDDEYEPKASKPEPKASNPEPTETIDKTETTEEIDMTVAAAKILQEPTDSTSSKLKAPKIKARATQPKADPGDSDDESTLTGSEIILKRKVLRPQSKVMQIGNGTVLYRNFGKLDKKRYSGMNVKVGSPKILMIDITACQTKVYPVVIYLSADSQHIDILEFAAKAIQAIEADEDGNYGCVKGQNYTISGYDNSARYIYMRLDRYKAASS